MSMNDLRLRRVKNLIELFLLFSSHASFCPGVPWGLFSLWNEKRSQEEQAVVVKELKDEQEWLALIGEEGRKFLLSDPTGDINGHQARRQLIWSQFSREIIDHISRGSITREGLNTLLEKKSIETKVLNKWRGVGGIKQRVYERVRKSDWELMEDLLAKVKEAFKLVDEAKKKIEGGSDQQHTDAQVAKKVSKQHKEKITQDFQNWLQSKLEDEKHKDSEPAALNHVAGASIIALDNVVPSAAREIPMPMREEPMTLAEENKGIVVTGSDSLSDDELSEDDQEYVEKEEDEEKYDDEGNPRIPLTKSVAIDEKNQQPSLCVAKDSMRPTSKGTLKEKRHRFNTIVMPLYKSDSGSISRNRLISQSRALKDDSLLVKEKSSDRDQPGRLSKNRLISQQNQSLLKSGKK